MDNDQIKINAFILVPVGVCVCVCLIRPSQKLPVDPASLLNDQNCCYRFICKLSTGLFIKIKTTMGSK